MLIIKSLFFHISIPKEEAYAIYTNDYFLDNDGNPVPMNTDRTDVYDYGDIIIQMVSTKYIIKKVYSAYDYAAKMINYIGEHRNDDVIYINMYDLNEYWEYHSGDLEIENL